MFIKNYLNVPTLFILFIDIELKRDKENKGRPQEVTNLVNLLSPVFRDNHIRNILVEGSCILPLFFPVN